MILILCYYLVSIDIVLYLIGTFLFSALWFLALWENISALFLHFWRSRFHAWTQTHPVIILVTDLTFPLCSALKQSAI